jgi:hypothetical protein
MHSKSFLVFLAALLASPGAWSHSVGGTHHGLMFFHWHIGDSGLVLGVPASVLGAAFLVLAAAAGVASIRYRRIRRRPAALSLAGTAALLAVAGTGLVAGAV